MENSDKQKPTSPRKKKVTKFFIQFFLSVLLLVALGWWGYTAVMEQVLGKFQPFSFSSKQYKGSSLIGAAKVVLVNPRRTDEFLHRIQEDDEDIHEWPYKPRNDPWPLADTLWYANGMIEPVKEVDDEVFDESAVPSMADFWKTALSDRNIEYIVIEEPGLTADLVEYDILILPSALLLSAEEREGVKRYLKQGGRVLGCWMAGLRDEYGEWLGYDFISQVIGAVPMEQVTDSAGGANIILRAGSPLTANIAPGRHLQFFTYNSYRAFKVVEPRTVNEGFAFSPYWRRGQMLKCEDCSMIMRGNYLDGNFIWMNFTPESVQPIPRNIEVLNRLLDNALSWLAGWPVISLRMWPDGYSAGAAFILEEHGVGPTQSALDAAAKAKMKLDLIIRGNTRTSMLTTASAVGDLLILGENFGSSDDQTIKDLTVDIKTRSRTIKHIFNREPVGMYNENWQVDEGLLAAAAKNKLPIILSMNRPESYSPSIISARVSASWWPFTIRRQIAAMPKNQLSLKEWVDDAGVKNQKELFRAMMGDIRRVSYTGGVYLAILDPMIMSEWNAMDMIETLAQSLKEEAVWTAPVGDLLNRASAWSRIQVSRKILAPGQLQVFISNTGKYDVENLTVDVFLRGFYKRALVTSGKVGLNPVNVHVDEAEQRCVFTIPHVNAGRNLSFNVRLSD